MTDQKTDAPPGDLIIYSATAVANWLINKNREDPSGLTHLKIQKLLYFYQGWHLAYFNAPLFEDPIEAWRHGPVVYSVYFALRDRGKGVIITEPIEKGYMVENGRYKTHTPNLLYINHNVPVFMNSIWNQYSKLEPWRLVAISHADGSPWQQVKNSNVLNSNMNPIIPVELMKSYFKSQFRSND
jgi:uncharacterized phage-associated protein